jgi:hypothetical protein
MIKDVPDEVGYECGVLYILQVDRLVWVMKVLVGISFTARQLHWLAGSPASIPIFLFNSILFPLWVGWQMLTKPNTW